MCGPKTSAKTRRKDLSIIKACHLAGGWEGKFGSFLESKKIREGEGVGATMEI